MDRDQARGIFKKIAASFPGWKWDEEVAKVWIDELETAEYDHAIANAQDYIRSGAKFAPALGEILKINPEIAARKEIERTRKMIDEELTRCQTPADPPWVREGIDKKEWMRREIAARKQPQ